MKEELHASELRGSGLSAATTLRPARCSSAAISASDRVAEVLTIPVIRHWKSFLSRWIGNLEVLLAAVYIGSDCVCIASSLRACWPLDPSVDLDCQLIAGNETLKSAVWSCLREGVCRVVVAVDPANLRNLATLI